MKSKYVPLDKRSKREQKEYHTVQRRDWGNLNPITRKVESGKVYNRKKSKQRWREYEPCLDFFIGVILWPKPYGSCKKSVK